MNLLLLGWFRRRRPPVPRLCECGHPASAHVRVGHKHVCVEAIDTSSIETFDICPCVQTPGGWR